MAALRFSFLTIICILCRGRLRLLLQLLACLRVIVATEEELQLVLGGTADPLTGRLNAENEEQTLQTLQSALEGMMEELRQNPLLLEGDDGLDGAAAEAANEADEAAAEHDCNGCDADWRMSRRFCLVYLQGQRHILQRGLRECELLAERER